MIQGKRRFAGVHRTDIGTRRFTGVHRTDIDTLPEKEKMVYI